MFVRLFYSIAALAYAVSFPPSAHAEIISGTFSGIVASGSFLTNSPMQTDVTGSPFTGSFDVSSVAGAAPLNEGPGSIGDYTLPAGAITYSFTIASINQTYTFGGSGYGGDVPAIYLGDNGTTQSVELSAGVNDPHLSTFFALTGPEGSLFSNINNLASLHIGPGVAIQPSIFLGVFQVGGATLDVTSETFAGQPVPEPPAAQLLAGSLALVAAAALMRRDKPTNQPTP